MKSIRSLATAACGIAVLLALPRPAGADEFYKGKTIRFVVGFAAGGGYDLAARVVGRHIGRHIPGNPGVVVENMTGAGSLIAANYTYSSAKPDGLFVGIWNSAFVLRQAMGDKAVRLDARKLNWIGAPTKGTPVCAIMGYTGLRTLEDVLAANREIKVGATGPGSTYDDLPKLLNLTLGTKFNVISGYEGTGTILVAMRRREVEGGCWTWESMRTTARSMLDAQGDDKLIPYLIHRRWEDPEARDLPLIPEVIKKDPDKLAAYSTWVGTYEFQRPFSVPPGTPPERVQILRKAFAETMKDPEFLAEAKKTKFEVTYVSGEQIEKHVNNMLAITPKAKELLQFLMVKPKK
ncbi:MAG TPA: tripartite tricarboxylate transporter substrate-binding protein [candidate division Zixibacteria bacterium]|nr:tripartite tricarboxylate transporter substrate-binding protein [candidate division Zixibacteria bacterium]